MQEVLVDTIYYKSITFSEVKIPRNAFMTQAYYGNTVKSSSAFEDWLRPSMLVLYDYIWVHVIKMCV